MDSQDLQQYFSQAISFISENIKKTNVFVHC